MHSLLDSLFSKVSTAKLRKRLHDPKTRREVRTKLYAVLLRRKHKR